MEFDFEQWKRDLANIPQDLITNALQALIDEPKRREQQKATEAAETAVVENIWRFSPELKPAFGMTPDDAKPWKQPTGVHDAYPPNAYVTNNEKTWQNICGKLNVWQPGADGPVPTWAEVTITSTQPGAAPVPEFVPPTGAHDAYRLGAKVTWQGQIYESAVDFNVHSPADYPAGWKLIEEGAA